MMGEVSHKTILKRNFGKPKELWKTLNALGLPNKVSMATINAPKDNTVVKYYPKSISEVLQACFANTAETVLQKFPPPSNKNDIDSVKIFYKDLDIITKFQLKPTTEVLKLQKPKKKKLKKNLIWHNLLIK